MSENLCEECDFCIYLYIIDNGTLEYLLSLFGRVADPTYCTWSRDDSDMQ